MKLFQKDRFKHARADFIEPPEILFGSVRTVFPYPNTEILLILALRITSCAFFLKELFVRANRKCIFTGNYVTCGNIDSFK